MPIRCSILLLQKAKEEVNNKQRNCIDASLDQIPTKDLKRLQKHIADGKPMVTKAADIIKIKNGKAIG